MATRSLVRFVGTGCLIGLLLVSSLAAQERRLQELNDRVVDLYESGRYAEAIPLAEEALRVAEATFGPGAPQVARVLDNLGLLYDGLANTLPRSYSTSGP